MTKEQLIEIGIPDKTWVALQSFRVIYLSSDDTFETYGQTRQFYFDLNEGLMFVRNTVVPKRFQTSGRYVTYDGYELEVMGNYYESSNYNCGPFHTVVDIAAITELIYNQNTRRYVVTFNHDGGTGNTKVTVSHGLIIKDEESVKAGYRFDGWFLDGEKFNFNTSIREDIELVAHWTKIWTVTFDSNGGSPVGSYDEVVDGQFIDIPADPIRDGHWFLGWLLDGSLFNFDNTPITSDLTLVASWHEIQYYDITFDSDGGSFVESITDIEEGTVVSAPEDPEKYGYEFIRWLDEDGNVFDFSEPINDNYNLIAEWSEILWEVSFNSAGGTPIDYIMVSHGTAVTEPTDPTREGYIFKGWYLDGSLYDFATLITEDIELIAQWEEIVSFSYNLLSLDGDGSLVTDVNDLNVIFENEYFDQVTNFEQIFIDKGFIKTGVSGNDGELTLKFNVNIKTVILNIVGDSNNDEITINNKTINLTDEITRYVITLDTASNIIEFNSDKIAKIYNIEFYDVNAVVPSQSTITVEFDYDDEVTSNSEVIINKWSKVAKPTDPTKDGHTFNAWVLSDGTAFNFSTVLDDDITLKALWTVIPVTVTFDSNGGTPISPNHIYINWGQSIPKPITDPTKENYEFVEWLLDGNPYVFSTPVTSDITLVASWVESGGG